MANDQAHRLIRIGRSLAHQATDVSVHGGALHADENAAVDNALTLIVQTLTLLEAQIVEVQDEIREARAS